MCVCSVCVDSAFVCVWYACVVYNVCVCVGYVYMYVCSMCAYHISVCVCAVYVYIVYLCVWCVCSMCAYRIYVCVVCVCVCSSVYIVFMCV